jgi:Cu-processing system permease protein
MDRHATRILKYETHNLVRTRWLPAMGILLFAATEVLFRFGGDPAKVVTSLMNVALVILPLVCLVVGTVYFYNAREFNELLLAQPMNRASLYLGKLISFTAAISAAYLMGLGLPFLIHNYQLSLYAGKIATLLAVGLALIVIFSAMAFWVATRYEEKIKGLGYVILLWFFLAVVYDGDPHSPADGHLSPAGVHGSRLPQTVRDGAGGWDSGGGVAALCRRPDRSRPAGVPTQRFVNLLS